ncbi:MAG: ABC transporter substrate-binding protein [Candidatus Binatia bacterium]
MRRRKFLLSALFIIICVPSESRAASLTGYTSFSSHEEIVAQAKKERKVRIIASMDPAGIKAAIAAFSRKYPFIEPYIQETKGSDADQRLLLEIKSGTAGEWDVIPISADFSSEYLPYLWTVDFSRMAREKILHIPLGTIDPQHPNRVASFTHFQVTAYNPKLVPAAQVPKTWEDLLQPQWKGRKIAVDIRPSEIAALVPAWGLEKTVEFARRIAAHQPVWVRGASRTLTSIIAGEIPMMASPNFGSVKKMQVKDRTGLLQYSSLEPVPVRFGNLQGILSSSQRRHAALLWIEWLLSPEAQKIIDDIQFSSSLYVADSLVERELRGKKLSVVDWEHHQSMEKWISKVVEAYGFPKAEAQR